jgi:hypothetical protein
MINMFLGAVNQFSASAKERGQAIDHLKLGKETMRLSHIGRPVF